MKIVVIISISLASLFVQATKAGPVYKYKDAEGNLLYTNIPPEKRPQGKDKNGKDYSSYEYLVKTTEFSNKSGVLKREKTKTTKTVGQPPNHPEEKPKKAEAARSKAALGPWTK